MTDIATVYMKPQIGVESTPGTGVDADTILQSIGIKPALNPEISKFSAMGHKFDSIVIPVKEWSTASIDGLPDYNELTYLLAGIMTNPTPSGASLAKTRVFEILDSEADDPATYTVEFGSSVRAMKFAYGIMNDFNLTFNRATQSSVTGSMVGGAIADDVTMTAGAVANALMPILSSQVCVYTASTQAGLAGAGALERVLSASLSISDRFNMLWALNCTKTSFAGSIEKKPNISLKLKMGVDDAGMAYLTNLRAGSQTFIRIKATGSIIESAVPHSLTIDLSGKVSAVTPFEDADGLYAVEWTFVPVLDATWEKAMLVTLVNTLSAL